ncbi:MAG TPA: DUF4258 domain-containing protein [Bacteroidia bacterium]|nr:DUF4258 domain-containing protein [Bacteroidia bacterium]
MELPKKNADLYRRFKLYGFGLLLGVLIVNFVYKGKGCQMPGSAKLEELSYQKLELTKHGACRMECRNISEAEIKDLLKTGKINYSKSEVRDKPCGTYAVEGTTKDGQNVRIVIADCDTISRVVTAIDLGMEKDSCECK